jgi:hypothetical protein
VNIERTFYTIMTCCIFSWFFAKVASTNRLCRARTRSLPRINPRWAVFVSLLVLRAEIFLTSFSRALSS